MRALVACVLGTAEVDLAEDEVIEITDEPVDAPALALDLPLLVAAAAHGSPSWGRVGPRPPSCRRRHRPTYGGATWREVGSASGPGPHRDLARRPHLVLYATAERLHLSRDGGRFWQALSVELPGITAVTLVD